MAGFWAAAVQSFAKDIKELEYSLLDACAYVVTLSLQILRKPP